MSGILCSHFKSKVDSGKLTKVEVEEDIKITRLSQKILQIGKFALDLFHEPSKFPIGTDKVISITKNLDEIKFNADFKGK
jgi:hypothetical protein